MLLRLVFLVAVCHAILDNDFLSFVRSRYGDKVANNLNRADLGPNGDGSFGGGRFSRTRRPVVMIHGLRNRAGYLWRNRKVLQDNGWEGHAVLATSWGHGDTGVWEAMKEQMKCEYVKNVRYMLLATVHYYQSEIDVLAFSMGSPITRKAILGGHCVDTNEYIGEPITHHINTYISVAGANQGSSLCNFAFPGVCGMDTGLNCLSTFLKDINAKTGYEGRNRYFIYSSGDEIIGTINGCGTKSGEIKGATEVAINGFNHDDTMFKAIDKQLELMKKHI